MSRRKIGSGGQAIVMVTLALFAMAGMMGLAVDLGWSFFVHKQAQASADAAALGAVQEAVSRIGGGGNVSAFTCAGSGTGSNQVDCEPIAITCGGARPVPATSNLNNGCLYAKSNGFDYTNASSRQNVSVQSSDGADVNRPAGVNRIAYWVTVRTVQTIPQLFSFVQGNTVGTVAAVATAGIVGAITPGSFYGLNHRGDCQSLPGVAGVNCGMDFNNGALGNGGACPGGSTGTICAPGGIFLGSDCSSVVANQCSQNFAGDAGTHHGVETVALVVRGTGAPPNGGATPGDWHDSTGTTITPSYSNNAATFRDPTYPNPQPPLQASSTMASCGVKTTINGGTLGPYQYYHYTNVDGTGKPIPDGGQVAISGNVTFSTAGTCPNPAGNSTLIGLGGTTQSGSNFPTYVFYGGLNQGGNTTLGAGQYVMAGVNSTANATLHVFDAGGTITGDTATGTMMIFTDGSYPGLTSQRTALPNSNLMPTLYQGDLNFKNPTITMNGLVDGTVAGSSLPDSMNVYAGVVWWQDRRNSMVEYNQNPSNAPNCAVCTIDNGSVVGCWDQAAGQCLASQTTAEIVTDNHVTANSPHINLDPGNGSLNLTGVMYQPRGGWTTVTHGTGLGLGKLMFVTGSFTLTSGNDKLLLRGPSSSLITYKTSLIR